MPDNRLRVDYLGRGGKRVRLHIGGEVIPLRHNKNGLAVGYRSDRSPGRAFVACVGSHSIGGSLKESIIAVLGGAAVLFAVLHGIRGFFKSF